MVKKQLKPPMQMNQVQTLRMEGFCQEWGMWICGVPLACSRNKPLQAQVEIPTEAGERFLPDFSGFRMSGFLCTF